MRGPCHSRRLDGEPYDQPMDKRWLWTITITLGTGVALVIVLVMALTVRVPSPAPTDHAAPVSPTSSPTAAPVASEPASPTTPAPPTCENIMAPDFTTDWVPVRMEDPEPAFTAGIQCWWLEDPAVATDNVLIYGWAPATPASWEALVAERTAETFTPWVLEQDDRGTYLTHKAVDWVQDAEGYGTTYLFTGDALFYAQTRAAIADVAGPPTA